MGFGLSFSEYLLIGYSGLRGAVGLCLALIVKGESKIDKRVASLTLMFVSMEALLTLLINAPTTKYLVAYLGLADQTVLQK